MIRTTDHSKNPFASNRREMLSFPDKQLMCFARMGVIDSFDIAIDRYKDLLMNYVYYSIIDRDQSQRIVQEAFIRFYRKFTSFRDGEILSTRLYAIARYLIKQNLRQRKVNPVISEPVQFNGGQNSCEWTFNNALCSLDVRLREALVLHDINGMSYDEMARLFRKPVPTVKLIVHRARKNLQRFLKTELIYMPLFSRFSES
jgi:RNA polymerase sigma-70 factor, ECF subfamily